MRLQHSVSPPPPGRGSRKRKRGDENTEDTSSTSVFRVEPSGDAEEVNGARLSELERTQSGTTIPLPIATSDVDDDEGPDDGLPARLLAARDPETGLIYGRDPYMVKYLLTKAKHRWLLEAHEELIEELRVMRHQEAWWRRAKDEALDKVLLAEFG
jgi:hypothetical protein